MGFFYIIYLVICALLVGTILLQDGKTGGLVSVADSSQAVFGARGATSFLTKLTSVLAVIFMVLSLTLAFQSSPSNKSIASDFTPPTAPASNTAIQPTTGTDQNGQPPEGAAAEVIDPETGERKYIPLGEAIKDMEIITDPNELPEELRNPTQQPANTQQQKTAEEAKKKDNEPSEEKKKDDQ